MLEPNQVARMAKRKEKENLRFRTFLKFETDEEQLDVDFLRLHNELFAGYDCGKCRNCCKMYNGSIPEEDLEKDAQYLNITKEQFIKFFLKKGDDLKYQTKHRPCDFLDENNECMLGECRPLSCKEYPYTNKPGRIHSLYSVLNAVEVCPVAFEIFERLKIEYGFKKEK